MKIESTTIVSTTPLEIDRSDTMPWTQVYIGGLPRSLDPSDAEIEDILKERFGLSSEGGTSSSWAGPGTTIVKRDNDKGFCRGFAFLIFNSREGATSFVNMVNNSESNSNNERLSTTSIGERLPWDGLKAELSQPKGAKKSTKKKQDQQQDLSDLRLRRQRKAPIRKHPVIVSSNGKRSNQGNKNR